MCRRHIDSPNLHALEAVYTYSAIVYRNRNQFQAGRTDLGAFEGVAGIFHRNTPHSHSLEYLAH